MLYWYIGKKTVPLTLFKSGPFSVLHKKACVSQKKEIIQKLLLFHSVLFSSSSLVVPAACMLDPIFQFRSFHFTRVFLGNYLNPRAHGSKQFVGLFSLFMDFPPSALDYSQENNNASSFLFSLNDK